MEKDSNVSFVAHVYIHVLLIHSFLDYSPVEANAIAVAFQNFAQKAN